MTFPDTWKENREKEKKQTNTDFSFLLLSSLPSRAQSEAKGHKWCSPQGRTYKDVGACSHVYCLYSGRESF